jgi:hypothetical protein
MGRGFVVPQRRGNPQLIKDLLALGDEDRRKQVRPQGKSRWQGEPCSFQGPALRGILG